MHQAGSCGCNGSALLRAVRPPQLADVLPQPGTAHAALDPVQQELLQARQVEAIEQLGQGAACCCCRLRLAEHRFRPLWCGLPWTRSRGWRGLKRGWRRSAAEPGGAEALVILL